MTRLTAIQSSFASGEIDPKLRAQTNLKVYNEGAYRLRNLARLATGGVESRPPTLDLAGLPGIARLVDFEFSNTQRYVIAFYAGGLSVFDMDGALLTTLAGAPWDATTIFEMSYSQNADVMTLTHHDFLLDLKRTGLTTFTLGNLSFEESADALKIYQPYYKFADDTVTITPSGVTGSVTLTASSPVFVAGHVGKRFRIFDNEAEITVVTNPTTATGAVKGTLKGKLDLDPFRTEKGSGVVEVLHLYHGLSTGAQITLAGSNDLTGITGAQLTGTFAVTVVDELRYTIATAGLATESEDAGGPNVTFTVAGTAVRDWREPSINEVNGFPATVCFHEGRRWLAGTPMQPDGFFGSDALKPFRFDVGKGYDGNSVQGSVGLESISGIRHLISNGDLQVFTPTAEAVFVVRPGEPITPSNVRVVGAAGAGCGYVMPQIFDGATLYVQENGLSVHELVYSDTLQRYVATPISSIASHLLASGVRDCSVTPGSTSRAEQYAFFPVELGGVAVFHSMRAENVAGWTYWELGDGAVKSTAAIGPYTFFCVERDGAFRLYRTITDKKWQLDGAVVHSSGVETTAWTLDARVRGRTLAVYSERGYHGLYDIAADGAFTAPLPVKELVVGDPYFAELETVTPKVDLPTGSRDRLVKRIVRAIVEFEETSSAVIDGTAIELRTTNTDPSIAIAPFTGSYEFRRLGYERNPTVQITQEEPTFIRILGMTMEVSV